MAHTGGSARSAHGGDLTLETPLEDNGHRGRRIARKSLVATERECCPRVPACWLRTTILRLVKAVSRLLALDCEVVGCVTDGSALLEMAQRLQPDVIVLDVNLPNVHSLEACREMTRVNPAMKVIMFTAMDEPRVRQAFARPARPPSSRNWRPQTCCRPSSACVSTVLISVSLARRRVAPRAMRKETLPC